MEKHEINYLDQVNNYLDYDRFCVLFDIIARLASFNNLVYRRDIPFQYDDEEYNIEVGGREIIISCSDGRKMRIYFFPGIIIRIRFDITSHTSIFVDAKNDNIFGNFDGGAEHLNKSDFIVDSPKFRVETGADFDYYSLISENRIARDTCFNPDDYKPFNPREEDCQYAFIGNFVLTKDGTRIVSFKGKEVYSPEYISENNVDSDAAQNSREAYGNLPLLKEVNGFRELLASGVSIGSYVFDSTELDLIIDHLCEYYADEMKESEDILTEKALKQRAQRKRDIDALSRKMQSIVDSFLPNERKKGIRILRKGINEASKKYQK